jgi:ABC-2 type transport system ATP-binding protein
MAGRVTTAAIEVDRLVKRYGARTALAEVSFTVGAGEIVGLLGPNGAGKSTTLGVLATLVRFDAGTVTIAGHRLPDHASAARRELGLVPQHVAVYPTLGARENLRFFARAAGVRGSDVARTVADALDAVGLAGRADEPVARLSGGMRRRLNLAVGILHRPRVVLLDEPVVGVDPQSRERIFDAVVALARRGAAVLYSTHQMDEAERLCTRIVLLDDGSVVAAGTPGALVESAGLTPLVHLRTADALDAGWLAALPAARVTRTEGREVWIAVADAAALPAVLGAALRAGADVEELSLHRPTLGDAFFALTGRALRDEEPAAADA